MNKKNKTLYVIEYDGYRYYAARREDIFSALGFGKNIRKKHLKNFQKMKKEMVDLSGKFKSIPEHANRLPNTTVRREKVGSVI